jgi:hypothetical protein
MSGSPYLLRDQITSTFKLILFEMITIIQMYQQVACHQAKKLEVGFKLE